MKKRHKVYLKLNLMSLLFVGVSFISVTLAWFAFNGLTNVGLEVGVKSWAIEMEKDGKEVSNEVIISLPEIYPGMQTVTESINVKNKGDSDAKVNYEISSVRILDKENIIVDEVKVLSKTIEDKISHDYPFHVNISLDKHYAMGKTGESNFSVSISWPLDSGNDKTDSDWGTDAYKFKEEENAKYIADNTYAIRSAIEIVISIKAEQYIGETGVSDVRYNLGDNILFDPINNNICQTQVDSCISTYVIDVDNKIDDETVTLLPNVNSIYSSSTYNNYQNTLNSYTSNWEVTKRGLLVDDILRVISQDISNSVLTGPNISDAVIGYLGYENRLNTELNKTIGFNGYYKFLNSKYNFLNSNTCYWTETNYDDNNAFAIKNIDAINSKVYNELKSNSCNIIPVIEADKTNLG